MALILCHITELIIGVGEIVEVNRNEDTVDLVCFLKKNVPSYIECWFSLPEVPHEYSVQI